MSDFPKLPNKPECLGFRKTIVLNIDEHTTLKATLPWVRKLLENDEYEDGEAEMMIGILDGIIAKLNALTTEPPRHFPG